jgi:hypothetical protein
VFTLEAGKKNARKPFYYKDRVAQTRDKLEIGAFFVLSFTDWEKINYSVHRKNILDNIIFYKLLCIMFGVNLRKRKVKFSMSKKRQHTGE